MPRESGFENKRVVIVGGSSGIGLAVAEEAASQGADVVIVSRKAERVQEAIQSIGGEARGQAVDVSDEKAVESAPAPAPARKHFLHVGLVNSGWDVADQEKQAEP
jgi:NAD(P)-dependent dehydrogenase (short-subunit alcohol dehydrogenase family)